jgi:hypothetical protein
MAVGVAVGIATAGIGNIFLAGLMTGFTSGFAGGFAGTALHGGSFDDCMYGACIGGWAGGAAGVATAGVMAGIGCGLNNISAPSSWGNCVVGNGTNDIVSRYSASLGNWATHLSLVAGNALGTSASGFGGAIGGASTAAVTQLLLSTGAIGTAMAGGPDGCPRIKTSYHPTVINNTNSTVYFKPETTMYMNGTLYEDNGSYPIGPYSSTNVPIDGINVQGNIIKVTDGYKLVTIEPTGEVDIDYTGASIWDHIKTLGGGKQYFLPANNWINLRNSINLVK